MALLEGLSIAKIQGIKDIGYLVNGIAKSLIQKRWYSQLDKKTRKTKESR